MVTPQTARSGRGTGRGGAATAHRRSRVQALMTACSPNEPSHAAGAQLGRGCSELDHGPAPIDGRQRPGRSRPARSPTACRGDGGSANASGVASPRLCRHRRGPARRRVTAREQAHGHHIPRPASAVATTWQSLRQRLSMRTAAVRPPHTQTAAQASDTLPPQASAMRHRRRRRAESTCVRHPGACPFRNRRPTPEPLAVHAHAVGGAPCGEPARTTETGEH